MLKDDKNSISEEWMDEVLSQSPEFSLSENFADKVAVKVARRFAWEQYFREFLLYLSLITGILIITGGIGFVLLEASWKAWFNFISTNSVLVSGVIFMLLFVLFMDKVLLPYFFYRFAKDRATGA